MKPIEKYFPILQKALDQYEKDHPRWQIEILVSIIKQSLMRLKDYIEDAPGSQITWNNPFVELHYPIGWNWKKRRSDDVIAPGGHIYGKITPRNTATKEQANKTLSQIMANQFEATVLANATNWAWYEKLKNYYTPVLPVRLVAELNDVMGKRKKREHFDELMSPFSIGARRIAFNFPQFKSEIGIPKPVRKQLAGKRRDMGPIQFSGTINGRLFVTWLVFEIHPLIADYDTKKAYHPLVIGLGFPTQMVGRDIVEESPAEWPRSDRLAFWDQLIDKISKLGMFAQEKENNESVTVSVNSKIKIPAEWWHPDNRIATMKLIADAQGHVGEIMHFGVGQMDSIQEVPRQSICNVCGWIHDSGFTQIKVAQNKVILLGGVLPDIVAVVHRSHERGLAAVSTKDTELQKIIGSYKHPSKAFDDLKHREDYKILFNRRRGFISLRAASGINLE